MIDWPSCVLGHFTQVCTPYYAWLKPTYVRTSVFILSSPYLRNQLLYYRFRQDLNLCMHEYVIFSTYYLILAKMWIFIGHFVHSLKQESSFSQVFGKLPNLLIWAINSCEVKEPSVSIQSSKNTPYTTLKKTKQEKLQRGSFLPRCLLGGGYLSPLFFVCGFFSIKQKKDQLMLYIQSKLIGLFRYTCSNKPRTQWMFVLDSTFIYVWPLHTRFCATVSQKTRKSILCKNAYPPHFVRPDIRNKCDNYQWDQHVLTAWQLKSHIHI